MPERIEKLIDLGADDIEIVDDEIRFSWDGDPRAIKLATSHEMTPAQLLLNSYARRSSYVIVITARTTYASPQPY